MTLYVVTTPDPPAGEDFAFVVPGHQLYDVTGITATLTTQAAALPTTAADASGNHHDGTYVLNLPTSPFVPGLVTGDLAVDFSQGNHGYSADVDIPFAGINWAGSFTLECWTKDPHLNAATNYVISCQTGFGAPDVFVQVAGGPHPTITVSAFNAVILTGPADQPPGDGLAHHIVITSTAGATVRMYVDGALVFTSGVVHPQTGVMNKTTIGGDSPGNPFSGLIEDEVAVYATALSGARVAAHFAAAAVSFAAYSAAVLADTPLLYFHLDDVPTAGGRQPSLRVTNGTTELEAIPTGFPATTSPGPYVYAWEPQLNADSQSSDGKLTTVAVPRLLLPAGYLVGSRTLDLQPSDQWSQVALWWDDTYQKAVDPLNAYAFPGVTKLVYQQIGT